MLYETYLVGQYEKIKKQSGHAFKGVSDGVKDRRRDRSVSPDFAFCFLHAKPEHRTQLIYFTAEETGGQRE